MIVYFEAALQLHFLQRDLWSGHFVLVGNSFFYVRKVSLCSNLHWQVVETALKCKKITQTVN